MCNNNGRSTVSYYGRYCSYSDVRQFSPFKYNVQFSMFRLQEKLIVVCRHMHNYDSTSPQETSSSIATAIGVFIAIKYSCFIPLTYLVVV